MKKYLAFYGTSPLQMNRKENSICHFAKLSLSLNDILKSRLTNRFGFLRSKFVFNIPTTYLHPGISDIRFYLVKYVARYRIVKFRYHFRDNPETRRPTS